MPHGPILPWWRRHPTPHKAIIALQRGAPATVIEDAFLPLAASVQTISGVGAIGAGTVGTPTVTRGAVSVAPAGIGSGATFGTPAVGQPITGVGGVASGAAFGTPSVTVGATTVSPTGIGSAGAFGVAVVSAPQSIGPTGIPSTAAFGVASISTTVTIHPTPIVSREHFGVPRMIGSGASRIVATLDEELAYYARLSFPFAQFMLGSYIAPQPVGRPVRAVVGWHGADFDDREGSFALARIGGGLEGFVGQVVRIVHGERSALVYVVASTQMEVDEDLSVSRRVYLALDLLWTSSLSAYVTART